MAKAKTIASIVEKVAVRLQLLRRMEDSDDNGYAKCISCGKVDHYKEMNGGHYKSRGKLATKLNEKNINGQCVSCNGWPDGETGRKYAINLDLKYGEGTAEELELESRKVRKYTRDELSLLLDDINKRIKIQEERLC